MSMHEYPVFSHGAFYVDSEVAAYIHLAFDKSGKNGCSVPDEIAALTPEAFRAGAKAGDLPADYCNPSDIVDIAGMDAVEFSRFEGNISTISEAHDYTDHPLDVDISEDTVCYFECNRAMSLFEKAYNSVGELCCEFKYRLKEMNLPDDFDWYAHIVDIEGNDFG